MEDLNSGSLQEQQMSLTTESFLLTTSNFLDQIVWSHFEMQMEFLPYRGLADDFMMFWKQHDFSMSSLNAHIGAEVSASASLLGNNIHPQFPASLVTMQLSHISKTLYQRMFSNMQVF